MYTVFGYQGTLASSTTPTYTALTPISDPIATISGNFIYVGALQNLIGAVCLGPTASKTKIDSPSILSLYPYQVAPVVKSALPTQYMNPRLNPSNPVALVQNEGVDFQSSNSSSSATSDTLGLIFMSDGALAPVSGKILTARATYTTSATAATWQNAAITFDTNLPAGNYQLVGARVEGAHARAFRIVFQGNASVRPGGVASLGVDGEDILEQRYGRMGVWGTFTNFNPPSIDTISDGNSETATLYLDLIKQ